MLDAAPHIAFRPSRLVDKDCSGVELSGGAAPFKPLPKVCGVKQSRCLEARNPRSERALA
jgi:hypothetical protein